MCSVLAVSCRHCRFLHGLGADARFQDWWFWVWEVFSWGVLVLGGFSWGVLVLGGFSWGVLVLGGFLGVCGSGGFGGFFSFGGRFWYLDHGWHRIALLLASAFWMGRYPP